ncbi:hypothetical protein VNO77_42088 [Canavalia gladiata]|uniref:Uncharacterized protein n=1 Tax=Canavalia gladiata TaxID=3824 RepID=A0AAN9PS39_CANGL
MNMSREERARTPYVDYWRPIIADGDTGLMAPQQLLSFEKCLLPLMNKSIDLWLPGFSLMCKGKSLANVMAQGMAASKNRTELQDLEDEWLSITQLKTLLEAIMDAIKS